MEESNKPKQERLFEELCSPDNLRAGFKAVKKNRGSPGIDRISVVEFNGRLEEEIGQLKMELESWTYKPKPVRRVEIPKPSGGVRLLGVPCVRDRVVQATLKLLLEPILDPLFSKSSFGFRPGRNQRQAVEMAREIVKRGKWCIVDIDLSKFFDRIHHDRLISRLAMWVKDKRILRLIGLTLRSGVMKDGMLSPTNEGSTQGSPLSPLLSNVVLDELDKELERRKLEFCRFADDANIFVPSFAAGERVMKSISTFIETKLKLVVNREKSKVAASKRVKFLGMTIWRKTIIIAPQSIESARKKIKELTPRGTHLSLEKSIVAINKWYRGWSNYFSMTQYPSQLGDLEAHIRRRLRARIVSQQKKRRNLFTKLAAKGVNKAFAAKTVFSNRKVWHLSHSRAVEQAYSNKFFTRNGLKTISEEHRPHWFKLSRQVRLR